METLIISYSNSLNRCCDPVSKAALEAGIMHYSYGGRQKAIELFTKAAENPSDQLAYVCRAVCYAEDANCEGKLLDDVKKCFELDYRNLVYLTKKAEEFKLFGRISASFRIIKALGSSMETYKLSVGKFFPRLLDGKALKKSEIKRFKDLEESWRKIYLPTLEQLDENIDPDLQPNSETDPNSIKAIETDSTVEGNEHTLGLKKKGDELREEKKHCEALECYNKASELDKSEIDVLLCKARLYYDQKKYPECIREAEKIVALYNRQESRNDCLQVFEAFRLIGLSRNHNGCTSGAAEALIESMQVYVPAARIEQSIDALNQINKGCKDELASSDALDAGFMHYTRGNRCEAIKQFTKAIEYDKSNPLIYAFRAICYVEDPKDEENLVKDIKECIDLDYRFINYFLDVNLANEMTFLGDVSFSFKLYKAVSLSGAEFKRSATRIFPRLLDNKILNKSERERFNELDESWRIKYLPKLKRLLKF